MSVPQRFRTLSILSGLLVVTGVGCNRREPSSVPIASKPTPAPKTALPTPVLLGYVPTQKDFVFSPKPQKRVALTFDAGSDDKAVDLILTELKKHDVKATFFLTGKFCEKFPAAVKKIADAGMEIGNHSFSHPKFTSLTSKQMLDQLNRAEQTIYKATGKTAKPLFRYPYGAHNKDVAAIVTNAGYQSIYWSVDSLDSVGKKKTPDFLAERVISKLQDGGISLMHVSSVPSAEALPRIFAHLEKEGFKVVPVSELLREAQQAVKRETGEAP